MLYGGFTCCMEVLCVVWRLYVCMRVCARLNRSKSAPRAREPDSAPLSAATFPNESKTYFDGKNSRRSPLFLGLFGCVFFLSFSRGGCSFWLREFVRGREMRAGCVALVFFFLVNRFCFVSWMFMIFFVMRHSFCSVTLCVMVFQTNFRWKRSGVLWKFSDTRI